MTEEIEEMAERELRRSISETLARDPIGEHEPYQSFEAAILDSPPEVSPPIVLYSFNFDAEQLLILYGALTIYLKVLSQQESADLEAIERTVMMMIQIKPQAVEASRHLALKAAGMEGRDARAN